MLAILAMRNPAE